MLALKLIYWIFGALCILVALPLIFAFHINGERLPAIMIGSVGAFQGLTLIVRGFLRK